MEGKNKRINTDLGQLQAQEGGSLCDTFCAFCELTRACTRAKILTKPLAMLTFSRVGWSGLCRSTGLSSRLSDFCWLSSLPCFHLLTASVCRLSSSLLFSDLPSLVLPVSWEISRAGPLCGFRTKTNKGVLWMAPTHPHNECPTSCPTRLTPKSLYHNTPFVVYKNIRGAQWESNSLTIVS